MQIKEGGLMVFLYNVLDSLLGVYVYIIIIRAVVSWFWPSPDNQLYRLLVEITEPALSQVRRFMPNLGGIDLSPLVLIIGIQWLVRGVLLRLLFAGMTL